MANDQSNVSVPDAAPEESKPNVSASDVAPEETKADHEAAHQDVNHEPADINIASKPVPGQKDEENGVEVQNPTDNSIFLAESHQTIAPGQVVKVGEEVAERLVNAGVFKRDIDRELERVKNELRSGSRSGNEAVAEREAGRRGMQTVEQNGAPQVERRESPVAPGQDV